MLLPPLPSTDPSHSCCSYAFNTRHQWKKHSSSHSVLAVSMKEPVASWGSLRIKAIARHVKPLILAHCRTNLQLLYVWVSKHCDGETPPPPPQIKHTHTDQDIQTVQIHIWSVFVPILQSWKRGHSQDTPGTLLSKQASQRRRRSVIISTMTVWVYTKCHSGKRLLSGETASLFLCLTHLQYRSQCCCGLLPFS